MQQTLSLVSTFRSEDDTMIARVFREGTSFKVACEGRGFSAMVDAHDFETAEQVAAEFVGIVNYHAE